MTNDKEVAGTTTGESTVSFLADSLVGVLKKDYDDKEMRDERIKGKYEYDQ